MRVRAGLALAGCLLALACAGRTDAPPPLPAPVTDPMVVAVDGLAPANSLDGQGSLFLGEGWGKPEGTGQPGEWGSMSWVVGREAAIHLFLPPGSPMDFYGRGLPFPWAAGSPVQTMELLAGTRVVGRIEMVQDWSDIRIPLPDDLPQGQFLDLRLRFEHATVPENDARSLAAAFTQLAVIPRAVDDPRAFLEAHSFDPATRRVVLPAGGGLRLPVPASSRIEVRLKDLLSHCGGCRLSLELTGPGQASRTLLTEERQDAAEVRLDFDTGPRTLQSLWLRVSSPQPLVRGSLELVLDRIGATPRPDAAAAPAHVFVYVIDTLRADELAFYGGRPALMPHMNAFAAEAATYLDARAPSSWTLPSVVSLLTGLYPDRHGVLAGSLQYDPERTPGLQHLLGRRGYRTVCISHSPIVSPAYGVSAGFGSYYLSDHLNGWQLRSEEARGLLAGWLSQDLSGAPVFAYIHTVDPHAPYSPPARFRGAMARVAARAPQEDGLPLLLEARGLAGNPAEISHLRSLYDGEVRYADQELGRFLDFLKWTGLYDRSFVILVGDHGEEFAEHGGFEHGRTLFDELLRVPLIVKYPGGRWGGARIQSPVSLVDVAPTVMAAVPGEAGPDLDGKVLPGPGDARPGRQPVYFEVTPYQDPGTFPVDLRGLVVDGVKCLENRAGVDRAGRPAPRFLAFDLAADRAEQKPLAQDAAAAVRCRDLLTGWSRSRERLVQAQRSQKRVSPEAIERLRALGYAR